MLEQVLNPEFVKTVFVLTSLVVYSLFRKWNESDKEYSKDHPYIAFVARFRVELIHAIVLFPALVDLGTKWVK